MLRAGRLGPAGALLEHRQGDPRQREGAAAFSPDGPAAGPDPKIDQIAIRTRPVGLAHAAGFAVDDEENTIGLRCVAAPIFDELRRPVAAISVAAPAERFPKHEVAIRGMMVAAAARRITYAIGGAEPKRA